MPSILTILYLVVGMLIAVPYCILAGWDTDSFGNATFVAPAFFFVWFLLAMFAGIVELDEQRKIRFNWKAVFGKGIRPVFPWALRIFWGWTAYIFLPILLHWGAFLLEQIGHESIAQAVDYQRYASLLYLFGVFLLLVFVATVKEHILETVRRLSTLIAKN